MVAASYLHLCSGNDRFVLGLLTRPPHCTVSGLALSSSSPCCRVSPFHTEDWSDQIALLHRDSQWILSPREAQLLSTACHTTPALCSSSCLLSNLPPPSQSILPYLTEIFRSLRTPWHSGNMPCCFFVFRMLAHGVFLPEMAHSPFPTWGLPVSSQDQFIICCGWWLPVLKVNCSLHSSNSVPRTCPLHSYQSPFLAFVHPSEFSVRESSPWR